MFYIKRKCQIALTISSALLGQAKERILKSLNNQQLYIFNLMFAQKVIGLLY